MKKIIFLIVLPILLISCGPSAKFVSKDYSKPEKIAILPTINQTIDVNGAIVFRNLFYISFLEKEYTTLIDITVVDSLLNEQGITDGGQLGSVSNSELFQILNVDGLIFIDLLNCTMTPLEPGEVSEVSARFRLYTAENDLIWEDERTEEHSQSANTPSTGNLLGDLIAQYAAEVVGKLLVKAASGLILEHELKLEMQKLIEKTLKTLP